MREMASGVARTCRRASLASPITAMPGVPRTVSIQSGGTSSRRPRFSAITNISS